MLSKEVIYTTNAENLARRNTDSMSHSLGVQNAFKTVNW